VHFFIANTGLAPETTAFAPSISHTHAVRVVPHTIIIIIIIITIIIIIIITITITIINIITIIIIIIIITITTIVAPR
jgi:hypothetical protein